MSLSCTVFEIFTLIYQKFKTSRVPDYTPFRDNLASVRWDMLWLTCLPNLKSLRSPVTKIWEVLQNVENGVVWVVRGHPTSSAIPPFDTAYVISYSSLTDTMRLSLVPFSRYSELFVEIRQLRPTPPTFSARFCWGWPSWNFKKIFITKK